MKQVVKNKKNKAKTFRSALSMFFKKNESEKVPNIGKKMDECLESLKFLKLHFHVVFFYKSS